MGLVRTDALASRALALVLRPGGAYEGESAEDHRPRVEFAFRSGQWLGLTRTRAGDLGVMGTGDPLFHDEDLVVWVHWWHLTEQEVQRVASASAEDLIRAKDPMPMSRGPHVYLADVAVDPSAGALEVLILYRFLREVLEDAQSFCWHRQRRDGRRHFCRVRFHGRQ